MINMEILEKYAKLVVNTGVNVQENQGVIISASPRDYLFVRMVVEECYNKKASFVITDFNDSYLSRLGMLNQSEEQLCEVPEYVVEKQKYLIDKNVCKIHILSPNPEAYKGVDAKKMQKAQMAVASKLAFAKEHQLKNINQWSIIAVPNEVWAKKVFPNLAEEQGIAKLWEAILSASRVTKENNPVTAWEEHTSKLEEYCKKLNDYNFKTLHFKNKLGTDFTVDLIKDHIWAGGAEYTSDKHVLYAPNIPTEEVFTMPHKLGANGVVVATKPLSYQGKLITDFRLTFKDGKVINYDAKEEKETLKNLIEFDEGSSYLGEVALISDNSPISNMNILFYNTLFDENASCHLALGSAYSMNVKNGTSMTKDELIKIGSNDSNTHVDFMFGSSCMNIKGITYDNKEIDVFVDGNFTI